MSGRILVQMQTPVTQKPDAVEALSTYLNKIIEAGVLDLGAAKLVKSNKGDAFYTVTAKACSCPAATYHPGQPCKHQRKFFPQEQVATVAESGSIRATGSFKPFALLPSEKKAAKVAPSMLIDLHDITDREAAY
jgi:hypothetical protein